MLRYFKSCVGFLSTWKIHQMCVLAYGFWDFTLWSLDLVLLGHMVYWMGSHGTFFGVTWHIGWECVTQEACSPYCGKKEKQYWSQFIHGLNLSGLTSFYEVPKSATDWTPCLSLWSLRRPIILFMTLESSECGFLIPPHLLASLSIWIIPSIFNFCGRMGLMEECDLSFCFLSCISKG